MLLVQPVITFSHRHFFCVSALCLLQTLNYSFFLLSCHPSLFFSAYLFFPSWSYFSSVLCFFLHLYFLCFQTISLTRTKAPDMLKTRPCPHPQRILASSGISSLHSIFSPPLPQPIFPHCRAPATNLPSAFSVTEWEIKMWYRCYCSSICCA